MRQHFVKKAKETSSWQLLALLMVITALGPTTLNILVPALPNLAVILSTDARTIQLAVSLYLIGLASAQLFAGPLSDRYGRRPVVLGGLLLTAVMSMAALAVASVTDLIIVRVAQALGAATGIVVARAIVRDLYERDRAAAALGVVTTAMVIAPTFGPLIGGILDTTFGWKAIFLFVAALSFFVLLWGAITLPETHPRYVKSDLGVPSSFSADITFLARNRSFYGYVFCATLGSGTFFAFLGGAPHAVMTIMSRSSAEFGIWFVISSAGYMAGNFFTSRLSTRRGVDEMICWGLVVEALGVVGSLLLAVFAHDCGPAIVFIPQMVTAFGNGLMLPNAIAGAASVRPCAAGTASGLLGCSQMALGAAFVQLGGRVLLGANSVLPLAILLCVIVVAFAVAFFTLVRLPSLPLDRSR